MNTRDSKAEGPKNNINSSLVNKNVNYAQKTFELQKDTGEYQQTTLENLRTEYFLLNCNNAFDEFLQANSNTEFRPQVDEHVIEEELQAIYRKLCLSEIKKSTQNRDSDSLELSDEEDPKPHMLHSSELTASKNIWSGSMYLRNLQSSEKEIKSARKQVQTPTTQFADIKFPLLRKLLICTKNTGLVLHHALSVSGYLTSPKLIYGSMTNAKIDTEDKLLPANAILSSEILYSLCKTSVSLLTCGFEHCVVLTKGGTVASWGYGESGCLGHGNYISYTCPKLVKGLPQDLVYIESGAYHTSAVTSRGDLYVWGRSDVGQLGIGKENLAIDSMVFFRFVIINQRDMLYWHLR
jgi:hypothetical protein